MSDLRSRVRALCAPLPGAEASDPFGGGHEVWKVGGKIFACFGAVDPGVSVKTPDIDTATQLIDAGAARRAKYFHPSWINLPDGVAGDELAKHIIASYDQVRAGLTRKARAALPPRDTNRHVPDPD